MTQDSPLAAYTAQMRRARTRYLAVVTAVVVVIGVVVSVAWSRSEIHHVSTHVVTKPPAALQADQFSALPHVQWRTTDVAAVGLPLTGGTVVTHDLHTVRGRDVRTGEQTWYYRRTDRTVCSAVQQGEVVIAVYRLKGACNELTALNAETGSRIWTRTVDMDGFPLLGTPTIQVTPYSIVFTTPSVLYAISPTDGGTRYYYAPQKCTINRALLGNGGLLISQTCHQPDCSGKKFCADGPQLVLRNATSARSDSYGSDNPDQIEWLLRGNTDLPVSADEPLLAINPTTHLVSSYTADQGSRIAVALSPTPTSTDVGVPIAVGTGDVVRIGSVTYLVPTSPGGPSWSARTPGPVTVTPTQSSFIPDLNSSFIATAGPDGIQQLNPKTGAVLATFAVGSTTGVVYPAGSGFIVAGPSGTVVYQ